MTWRMVVVNEHCKLSYENGYLIMKSDIVVEKIHLSEIHTLILETTDIVITTALISKLVAHRTCLIFCDSRRDPLAELLPYYGAHNSSKKLSEQISWSEQIKKEVWTKVIAQKIENQRLHLNKQGCFEEANLILGYLKDLQPFDKTNREGHAAKVYFNALFGKKFTREQESDINAFLNYGYQLLLSTVSREVVKNGCVTQLALKHSNVYNQFNLSSDLMEPFRILVDEIVVELQDKNFSRNKHRLLDLFSRTYDYNKKEMYLTNIIEHYVKKTLQALNEENLQKMMEFRISE